MSYLDEINSCIEKSALVTGVSQSFLEEKKTETKVKLTSKGKYLQYDFEKIKPRLFPFFENAGVPGLHAIADKVLFVEGNKDVVWVFVIELKQNKGGAYKQIEATKLFVDFLIASVNRACKTTCTLKVRGFAYSKMYRPLTKVRKPFDEWNNTHISGESLIISNYFS
jgi:hypothetical protein